MENNIYQVTIPDARLMAKGAWDLSVYITDLEIHKVITVTGDMNIGGVMLRLVSDLGMQRDWSDHELWWPDENKWLNRSRSTLDQYGVTAAAHILFTPKHKIIRVQLPDLQYITVSVDMSSSVFKAVCDLCKSLGIRHGEELSFERPLPTQALKKNTVISPDLPPPRNGNGEASLPRIQQSRSMNSLDRSLGAATPPNYHITYHTPSPQGTLARNSSAMSSSAGEKYSPFYAQNPYTTPLYAAPQNGTVNIVDGVSEDIREINLANSPQQPSREASDHILKPRTLLERARLNAAWLDSSRSLYEQGIREGDTVLLRFKFFTFYDLNPKFDVKRINQIYEQARWMILNEEVDCTEEEAMLFAALQVQIQHQSQVPQTPTQAGEDDIDAALNDLQITLEGTTPEFYNDITQVPELRDYLSFLRPKKFTLRGFKPYYVILRDTTLSLYKDEHDLGNEPSLEVNLRGCEVTPDVMLTNNKYGIKLQVPMADGMHEMWFRCANDAQYAKWMAAFRLAAKGKTMADASYQHEVQNLLSHLTLQHTPLRQDHYGPMDPNLNTDSYVPLRISKKNKGTRLTGRIMDAHNNVRNLTLTDAKLQFIKAFQGLPDYAVHYFVVVFANAKKEELVGITPTRLIRADTNGRPIKTWPFTRMKDWHVNWYKKLVVVEFDDETVQFWPVGADAKNVHEFIGGYIFLATRAEDKNQNLDEELFQKLTGGWKA
ncbi:fermitin family homolog 2-like [Paramacrobiotus metropolitanus]|uniref:fermitin family homolog 2-like n=1 Tax=Paramacrobiotus metropolitanus TaxID=2943436 RepID=UPI002445F9CA|nr:fermitin family homolog 2-like [Paramacrobiotus metropolitanus]